MAYTVRNAVTDALREIGVLSASETATADDLNFGFQRFNDLLDQWQAEELLIHKTTRTTWTIVSGTQQYTLGLGGTINVQRPVYIDHVNYENTAFSPSLEFQLSPLTDDAWSRVPVKTLQSPYPTCWYYNPTFTTGLGTLELWPVPTAATLLGVIYYPDAVAEWATVDDVISLPPGYRRMLVTNLAVALSPSYERPPSAELQRGAMEAKAIVKRANKRLMDMDIEAAALGGSRSRKFTYSIFAGP